MDPHFEDSVIEAIKAIPKGKVSTYGRIAKTCGNKMGARDVSEILHNLSDKHNLPWQRVIGSDGKIAFNNLDFVKRQRHLLEKEGITFSEEDTIDVTKYLFDPDQSNLSGFF